MPMTRPTTEQITHQGRLLSGVLGDAPVNVMEYGAKGDGVNDDAPAINAAVQAAHAAGGGIVRIPAGTYRLATIATGIPTQAWYVLARDNVSIIGDGIDATILKVADGQNLLYRGTTGPFVIGTAQASPLSNCRFADFTVDWNGANNLLIQPGTGSPPDTARNNASIFSLRGGTNIMCERVRITATPGNQCIFFPAQSELGQGNITVRDCIFDNNGSAVAGNYCADHSSVYCNGDNLLYENNTFTNDPYPPQFMACYEIHGSDSLATGNVSRNYHRAFWIASDYKALSNITVENDIHSEIAVSWSLSAPTYAVDNIAVRGCTFAQKSGLTVTYPSFFMLGNSTISCSRLAVESCNIIGQGYSQAMMQHLRIRDVVLANNRISGFGSYGIISGGVDFGDGTMLDNLVVSDNVFTDVQAPVYFNTPLSTRVANGAVMITGNTFNRTTSDSAAVITLQFAASRGVISGNSFSSNYTTQYAGNRPGIVIEDQRVGTYVPVIAGGSVGGTGTYNSQFGQWILNGKICTVTVRLDWSAHTGSGDARISLPFTGATTDQRWAGSVYASSYAYGAGKQLGAFIQSAATHMFLSEIETGTAVSLADITSSGIIFATITYEIA
jgi:hypothetical protein